MSFTIGIYHPLVRKRVEAGEELDGFDHPPLDGAAVMRFVDLLARYGYQPQPSTSDCRAFAKQVSGSSVDVRIFPTEIAFSVPYGGGAENAILEALQDASELLEQGHMCLFNPQSNEWMEG